MSAERERHTPEQCVDQVTFPDGGDFDAPLLFALSKRRDERSVQCHLGKGGVGHF
jgi:hypothetical protein